MNNFELGFDGYLMLYPMSSEFSPSRLGPTLSLAPHPTARQKAISLVNLNPGTLILKVSALASVLLPEFKSRRCDFCFQLGSEASPIQKCTGCRSYWYCSPSCVFGEICRPYSSSLLFHLGQTLDWRMQHRKICKYYGKYISGELQTLSEHEKMDSLLLSHLSARISSEQLALDDGASPTWTFLSLLPSQHPATVPPICSSKIQLDILSPLFSRFGNNNFTIHDSRLRAVGHGIFPLASRLFNHSCVPNAAVRYCFCSSCVVSMEVVALRAIEPNEEVRAFVFSLA